LESEMKRTAASRQQAAIPRWAAAWAARGVDDKEKSSRVSIDDEAFFAKNPASGLTKWTHTWASD
jgi:hypothetical protein